MSAFHLLAPFDAAKKKWESYMKRFECFLDANDLLGLTDNRKRTLFLSHYCPEVFDTTESLSDSTPVHTIPWQVLQATLKTCYAPTPSKIVWCYEFQQRLQQEGETINLYIAALHKAVGHCEFRDLNDNLLNQLICVMQDIRFQRWLLVKPNLTLAATLDEVMDLTLRLQNHCTRLLPQH